MFVFYYNLKKKIIQESWFPQTVLESFQSNISKGF